MKKLKCLCLQSPSSSFQSQDQFQGERQNLQIYTHICEHQINQIMQFAPGVVKSKPSYPLILSVLKSPSKTLLRPIVSLSNEFSLFHHTQKKITLAAYKIFTPKTKLLSNLEIYEWRSNTEFPIVKTLFVHVEPNPLNSSGAIQVVAYNQYCPIKLSHIFEMSLGQCLYLLKEALIGFERLFNRFGGFQIVNSMITVNEKGCCRVWINQNFGLNSFNKRETPESKMVNKIITIIETHTQQSRTTKKLFFSINTCSTFLSSLKAIDQFVKESKILVPNRFTTLSSMKQIPRPQNQNFGKNSIGFSDAQPKLINRFSIKQERSIRYAESIREQVQKSGRVQKRSSSPLYIKRLKSQETLKGTQNMKVSDGETAHTGKLNRTSNIQNLQTFSISPKAKTQVKELSSYSPKKQRKWMEQSSYVMAEEQNTFKPAEKKLKKQLSYSEAFKLDDNQDNDRKYSCKLYPNKKDSLTSNYENFSKRNVNEAYFSEFSNVLDRDERVCSSKIVQVDQQRFLQEHSGQILKNNGWVSNVVGLMDMPNQLQDSFHEGQEENRGNVEIKLEKLSLIGRKQMHTSILPNQIDQLF